jgi:hypothetical protein
MENRRRIRSDSSKRASALSSRPGDLEGTSSFSRSSRIRAVGVGGSLVVPFCSARVRPKHYTNPRPSRRTRKSVRPTRRGRVSDRTMVRATRTRALIHAQLDLEFVARTTMPKRTTLRSQSHQKVSRTKQSSGPIAKPHKASRSVRTKSALDNLSHRTGLQCSSGRISTSGL